MQKVHVFSDSVLFVGTHKMSDEAGKFTARWKDHRPHGRSTRKDSKFFDCEFHVNTGATAMKLLEATKQNVSSTNDSIGNECTLQTYSHRIMLMGKRFRGYGQTSGRPTS